MFHEISQQPVDLKRGGWGRWSHYEAKL